MKRLFLQIFAWLAILLGVGLMLQPTVSRYLTEQKSTKTVQKFVQAAEAAAPSAPETSAAEPARAYPELYDAFLAYNQQLFAQGQSGLKDPFAYETPAFDLTGCGLPDDVIAALWIPRLDLELPVYLGANTANMARGGALLGQTSMPLGGENTNTVIAAHRGYYGAEMLRNVQQIQIGDKITMTTPWDTLVYRVCELNGRHKRRADTARPRPAYPDDLPPLHPKHPALPGDSRARPRRRGRHPCGRPGRV